MFRSRVKSQARDLMRDVMDWDVASWSKVVKLWQPVAQQNRRLDCLELGANKGGLSLWIALNGHKVICTDLTIPEERAKPVHSQYKVSHLVSFGEVDALNLPFENEFDVILFKSMIGGIARDGKDHLKQEVFQWQYPVQRE